LIPIPSFVDDEMEGSRNPQQASLATSGLKQIPAAQRENTGKHSKTLPCWFTKLAAAQRREKCDDDNHEKPKSDKSPRQKLRQESGQYITYFERQMYWELAPAKGRRTYPMLISSVVCDYEDEKQRYQTP
jgi:hypothetical protein